MKRGGLICNLVLFGYYQWRNEATMTSEGLTTEDILQSIQDEESSEDGVNEDVTASEGATGVRLTHYDCRCVGQCKLHS